MSTVESTPLSFTHYPQQLRNSFEALRARDYQRLDAGKHIYLDYTGGGLYAASQLQQHQQLLQEAVLGNPHSINPSSSHATELVKVTRQVILDFFRASPEQYEVIFTSNASGALKLVGESYPFSQQSAYLLSSDSHNSVLGIREFAKCKGAQVHYVPLETPSLRFDVSTLEEQLERIAPESDTKIFAYPAQSNFSGVQHDLDWIAHAQGKGWHVLLDVAAFVPTNRLDLSRYQPDFVSVSFYKMFGYPTGIGCLLARKSSLKKLSRPWFAGGTISKATLREDSHHLHESAEAFEDGTLDYVNIPAVRIGLEHLSSVGIDAIHEHVAGLTEGLLQELLALAHSNGTKLISLYGPKDMVARGGTLALNFMDKHGDFIPRQQIEKLASQRGISLRTGCFCSPGSCEQLFQLRSEDIDPCMAGSQQLAPAATDYSSEKVTGAVRISVGIASNLADVAAFLDFAESFLDD